MRMSVTAKLQCIVCISAVFLFLQLVLIRRTLDWTELSSTPGNCDDRFTTDAVQRLFYQPHDVNKSSLFIFTGSDCVCDLISVDCLDSVRCMSKAKQHQEAMIALGVITRRAIKQMTVFSHQQTPYESLPVGKGFQYSVIDIWKRWMTTNDLPIRYENMRSMFTNETWYDDCRARNVKGKACFFQHLNAKEDMYELERRAMENSECPEGTSERIAMAIRQFRNESNHTSSLANLMHFAHLARMRFNLAPFVVHDLYKKRLESVIHKESTKKGSRIRVAMHMRRADACRHEQVNYTTHASSLYSPPQMSNTRHCYATSVYLDALERVASQYETVDVYLSTDHAGSLIEELQADFGKVYEETNWFVLNYTNDNAFKYSDAIEFVTDEAKTALLGESAVADLYHLSHGQVFIGHLGSRFGKVSWLLAIARHNTFVPFYTVDGHSFCCEIDEACGDVKPYITSMENCLTFNAELSGRQHEGDYWSEGSIMRRSVFQEQQRKAKDV